MAWENRWHPLRREWVTVTGHRNLRPWQGEVVESQAREQPDYDVGCYLCPGNQRVSGEVNPEYDSVFVFDNDHPAFGADAPVVVSESDLLQRKSAGGLARVLCYSPRHNLTTADMTSEQILTLMEAWQLQTLELRQRKDVSSVVIFENRGSVVGMSNPHPHCQIYAASYVFQALAIEAVHQDEYHSQHAKGLLGAMMSEELAEGSRMLHQSDDCVAFVPFCARWPYEVWVTPVRRVAYIDQLDETELAALAMGLQQVLRSYRDLWPGVEFPYIMMLHQAPTDQRHWEDSFHFNIQLYPALRQPGLQKILGGIETGAGNFLNDRAPEQAAAELRAALS